LAAVRSAPQPSTGSDRAEALAETRVSISVAPAERAVEGVEFGLYRRAGDRLERLDGPGIHQVTGRGAASFAATGAALGGRSPGEHALFLVVAPRGALPPGRDLAAGEDPARALAAAGPNRVYPLRIRLLPPA